MKLYTWVIANGYGDVWNSTNLLFDNEKDCLEDYCASENFDSYRIYSYLSHLVIQEYFYESSQVV